jgi:hypothetical protein
MTNKIRDGEANIRRDLTPITGTAHMKPVRQ